MRTRSWRWLEVRIGGLLTKPPLFDAEGMPRFLTRIQQELFAPPTAAPAASSVSR